MQKANGPSEGYNGVGPALRRPCVHVAVLYASDPKVVAYSRVVVKFSSSCSA